MIPAGFNKSDYDMLCVLGPTASGKTRYAVQLARELVDCEIISADSRQVYRRMDIGTGKDLEEYGEIPYHLIDIAEPGTQFNVFLYKEAFAEAFDDIRSRGKFPILCGGTGFYITAVTRDYDFRTHSPLSAPRPAVSGPYGEGSYASGAEPAGDSLPSVSELALLGSGSAAGMTIPLVIPGERSETRNLRVFYIGTDVSRDERVRRIDRRLDERLQSGMIEEIRGLLESGVSAEVLLSYGLEYRFVTLYLLGDIDYATMRERLAIAIHQFSKRQMTWFRGMERSGIDIHWVKP